MVDRDKAAREQAQQDKRRRDELDEKRKRKIDNQTTKRDAS